MRRLFSLLVVVVVLTACASGGTSRPKNIAQPDLDARLMTEVFFGSQSSAPASVEVYVTNRANVPISVRKVEIDSPGMAQWTLRRTVRYFNEVVNPGEMKPISLMVTAVTTTTRPNEPLQIRAIVEFEAEGTRWREILMARQ